MQQKSFTAAMLDYFGKKPGQSNSDFLKEIKELTEADKAWFSANLPSVGYEIVPMAA